MRFLPDSFKYFLKNILYELRKEYSQEDVKKFIIVVIVYLIVLKCILDLVHLYFPLEVVTPQENINAQIQVHSGGDMVTGNTDAKVDLSKNTNGKVIVALTLVSVVLVIIIWYKLPMLEFHY